FLRFMSSLTKRDFERVIHETDGELAGGAGHVPGGRRSRVREDAFSRAEQALRKVERGTVTDKLLAFVREGEDLDVSRMRPFALADEWREDRRAVLGACLSGVRAGLLDMRWEIVCPSCRTATEVLPSLASLSDHGACQLCDLAFSLDLEDAVEATFAPAAALREVDVGPYCIGGPARTPHVLAQSVLPAGGEARLACPEEEGTYRLFVRGGATASIDVRAGAPAEVTYDPREGVQESTAVAPSGAIVVTNAGHDERHAKLERL